MEASPGGGKTRSSPDLISCSQLMLIIICARGIPLGTVASPRFDPWGQEGDSKQGDRKPGMVPPGHTLTLTPQGCICKSGIHRGTLPLTPTPLHWAAHGGSGNLVLIYNLSSLPPFPFYSYLFYSPCPCTLREKAPEGSCESESWAAAPAAAPFQSPIIIY